MKTVKISIVLALIASTFQVTAVNASVLPVVKSFKFTPNDVDSVGSDTKVMVEIVASHPSGIENTSVQVSLTNSKNNALGVQIFRSERPYNFSLSEVTFRGELIIPRDLDAGVYEFSASSISNSQSAGYRYETGKILPPKIRDLTGGETGLLVRKNGNLNLSYETFIGPSYDTLKSFNFTDTAKYNSFNTPIWRVGDTFDPTKYFELKVNALELKTTSRTPLICSSSGSLLTFLAEGNCSFTVLTEGTKDYVEKVIAQNVVIKAKRVKPQLIVPVILNQNIPLAPNGGYVFPQSATPATCTASGLFVKLESGGKCTITFQSNETGDFVASDVYEVSFEIVRDPQTITFTPPATANLASRTVALAATASSGGAVTYATTSTGICSVTGSTLNLLMRGSCAITATQAGTATLAPISATATVMIAGAAAATKKSITCVRGNKSKKVSGTNPKCPAGYKVKR
jgi:hypothetical protein